VLQELKGCSILLAAVFYLKSCVRRGVLHFVSVVAKLM